MNDSFRAPAQELRVFFLSKAVQALLKYGIQLCVRHIGARNVSLNFVVVSQNGR